MRLFESLVNNFHIFMQFCLNPALLFRFFEEKSVPARNIDFTGSTDGLIAVLHNTSFRGGARNTIFCKCYDDAPFMFSQEGKMYGIICLLYSKSSEQNRFD